MEAFIIDDLNDEISAEEFYGDDADNSKDCPDALLGWCEITV